MDRGLLKVLGASLVFALVVAGIFYQISARPSAASKPRKVELREVVVAARPLPMGVTLKPDDVKLIQVPAEQFPKGAFSKPDEVVGRPVISNILVEEPIHDARLARRDSGFGLAPIIPVGMRAVSVRVNDVVGVAGFVLPGMRVDVLVTGHPPGQDITRTRTVLQNIPVLSAGQHIQPDARGQPVNVPVVTLLVSPAQAEMLTLAGNEGRIQLVLRNAGDHELAKTAGTEVGQLYGAVKPPAPARAPQPPKAEFKPVAAPPPAPVTDDIVVIRGVQKTVETVRKRN